MNARLLWLLLLTACTAPAPAQQTAPSPLERAEAKTAAVIAPAVAAAVEAIASPEPPPVPEVRAAACRELAARLIVRWEVSSPAYYDRRLIRPIWPQGASGVTWGIGYDGGHQRAVVIADDWDDHEHRDRLAQTAGLTGIRARDALPRFRDIPTTYPHAYRVFTDRSLVAYERQAERAFRVDMADQPPGVCASLVSVTYNRGGSMTGDNRREMRAIRDDCLPRNDAWCTAAQLRAMCRLWRGTVNENGLCARRDMEADYATGAQP